MRNQVVKASAFFQSLVLTDKEKAIARQILKEVNARLSFLVNVGLDYADAGS